MLRSKTSVHRPHGNAVPLTPPRECFSVTVLAFCCTVLTGPSCGDANDDVRYQAGTLHVKGLFDFTGPTRDEATQWAYGILDSIDAANAGTGVAGYAVQAQWVDAEYSVENSVSAWETWSEQPEWSEVAAVFVNGTHVALALNDRATQEKKPLIGTSYAGSLSTPVPVVSSIEIADGETHTVNTPGAPYYFHPSTDYSTGVRIAVNYIARHLKEGERMAFAYDPSCEYCSSPVPAGRHHAREERVPVSDDLCIAFGATSPYEDTKNAVAAYFDDGANSDVAWFWLGNTTHSTALLARALATYAPSAKIVANVWGFSESLDASCQALLSTGEDNPCRGGRVTGLMPFAAYGDSAAAMSDVVAVHDAARTSAGESLRLHADVRYVQGYVSFLMWRLAVERLAADGAAVTGAALKEELESFVEVSTGGLTAPFTITPTDHRPTSGAMFYSISDDGLMLFEQEDNIQLHDDWKGW